MLTIFAVQSTKGRTKFRVKSTFNIYAQAGSSTENAPVYFVVLV